MSRTSTLNNNNNNNNNSSSSSNNNKKDETVYSDPYSTLPFESDKYAQSCEAIHLGQRGIQALRGFDKFLSLDTLWLNDNELTSLMGLEENFRLKCIYLHGNKLRRLGPEECLAHCTFLHTLTLNNNLLEDLENVFEELRPLHHLQVLDLMDNPIAQEVLT